MTDSDPLLWMKGITKVFPGVRALFNVDFKLESGEVRALVGENGAGKSTLIKILSGVYQPTEGEIYLCGEKTVIDHPSDAKRLGIAPVHQEVNLEPYLSVAENIFLERQPVNKFGLIDYKKMNADASYWLDQMGVSINPKMPLGMVSIAEKQMVAIAQAISLNAKIIIFDEPTSSLTQKETEHLFKVIQKLREKEIGIIYISHRLEEIFRICTSLTVMRDGQVTGNEKIENVTTDYIIRMMVGRELKDMFRRKNDYTGAPLLVIKGLKVKGILNDINIVLHKGEILGLSGLVGSGRTELARAIFGDLPYQKGEIYLDGTLIESRQPSDSIKNGIALIPEDRKEIGLVLKQSVMKNISVTVLKKFQKFGFIMEKEERKLASSYINRLAIKTPSPDQEAQFLSGGNQQRIVIAKWLATNPKVLIIDEPTRGIDVGAKSEIHELLDKLASEGMAILMISSELPEIITMSDRVAVMYQGRICVTLDRQHISEENIVSYATGQGSKQPEKDVAIC
ncbi:MAG: sugar ABC transporter ATP-binding protein [Flexilinea sp.]